MLASGRQARGDLSAAAGHTPLPPLNSQLRSATVTLSPAFRVLTNLDLNTQGATANLHYIRRYTLYVKLAAVTKRSGNICKINVCLGSPKCLSELLVVSSPALMNGTVTSCPLLVLHYIDTCSVFFVFTSDI